VVARSVLDAALPRKAFDNSRIFFPSPKIIDCLAFGSSNPPEMEATRHFRPGVPTDIASLVKRAWAATDGEYLSGPFSLRR
jgi:hypothetical protein